jgi:CDP-4-dehydro-6-deoxyglucose reductase
MIATIAAIRSLSPRVKEFVLQLPETVRFAAGQFVVMTLEVDGEPIQRSYSIANESAGETNLLVLWIALNEAGRVTPRLFQLCEGMQLEVSEPFGGFVLRDASLQEDVVFVCTGTGVAPFRSMIDQCLQQANPINVILVMDNRHREDVLGHAEWLQLAADEPRFRYFPVLSRPKEADDDMLTGYVHAHYSDWVTKNPQIHVYVCGWDAMCKEARQRLKDLGLTRRQYFFEQYDG